MKEIKKLLILMVILIATSCDTNDDGFYKNIFIDVPNLVTIETQNNYNVGDYLYVSANFYRILNDGALLDVYQSTGGARQFVFSYIIEKKISETEWQVVTVNDNQLDINSGTAQNGSYVYGICEYNETSETYEYNVGFPLLSVGNYRLSFGYNSSSTNSVELRSLSSSKNPIININSLTSNLDGTGYYYFNVN